MNGDNNNNNDDIENNIANNIANIVVIGAGWWSQGWHLPVLKNNPKCNIIAIVDCNDKPKSNLNPDLESLQELKERYDYPPTNIYTTIHDMLQQELVNNDDKSIDGVIIATPHSTHYEVCKEIMDYYSSTCGSSSNSNNIPHILMEKPMTTHITHAIDLYNMVTNNASKSNSQFWINHSANYRKQVLKIKSIIDNNNNNKSNNNNNILGTIKHINLYFASPLKWIFDDPSLIGWNVPTDGMIGNGFAWGQSSHIFAFIYHLLPSIQPIDVYCQMTHSKITGADISHSATIRCYDTTDNELDDNNDNNDNNIIIMNVTGTTLLPGNAHSDPPISKLIQIDIFGTDGSLRYGGNDREPKSGKLELRHNDGTIEILDTEFVFENLDNNGYGPESIQKFVELCCRNRRGRQQQQQQQQQSDNIDNNNNDNVNNDDCGANIVDGLRSIQTIDAMYRSNQSNQVEPIIMP